MKNFKISRILLPIDFSIENESAIRLAAEICVRQNAKLVFLHVVRKNIFFDDATKKGNAEDSTAKYLKECNEKLINISAKILNDFPIAVKLIIEIGDPGEEIINLSKKHSLVIIRASSKSGEVQKMGSTTYEVVKNSLSPVLVVNNKLDNTKFKKILYPIRVNQKVFEKYNYIEPIIGKNNSELIIVGLSDKYEPSMMKETVFSIDLLRNMCQEEKVSYSTIVMPSNNFAASVCQLATNMDADLIVISSHLYYDSKENHLSKFAEDVIDQAKCPVLCINPFLSKKL